MFESIVKESGLNSVRRVETYRAFIPNTGIEIDIEILDAGPADPQYRYTVQAKFVDPESLIKEGLNLPKVLVYGNGEPTPQAALELSHWTALNEFGSQLAK